MAKNNSLKPAKKNISKADVRVRELSQDEYGKVGNSSNKPLFCVTIDQEIVKTPNGNLIVFNDKRAMQELAAEIDYSDELDVQKLSLYSLLCTQIDIYEHRKLDVDDEHLQELLWNDPVLRPVAGPEVVEQLKYLQVVKDYLSERNINYVSLPQISFEHSHDYLKGHEDFYALLIFLKSNITKLNLQQLTVFANCIGLFTSPILGLMLVEDKIDAHEFAVTYLTMSAENSKTWGDTDRNEERLNLEAYTQQADIMVRYLKQFTPKWTRDLNVFLCHSSGDKDAVRKLYSQLSGEGWIDPWLDEEKLLPGEDWDLEIRKAVRSADVVIVVLSQDAVNKEGYVQKEIRQALDMADEKPEGMIFIIPLKIEPCDVPSRLSMWQWMDYYESGAYERLLKALLKRAQTLKIRQE